MKMNTEKALQGLTSYRKTLQKALNGEALTTAERAIIERISAGRK